MILALGDSVLLIKRKNEPFKGYWALVGGAKRGGEAFVDCALREVEEEVGIKLPMLTELGTDIFVENQFGQQLSIVFVGRLEEADRWAIRAGSEVTEAKFFDRRMLPTPIVHFHRDVIEKWINCIKTV